MPLDIELTEPFGIATGAQLVAQNVLLTVTLSDGTVGLGSYGWEAETPLWLYILRESSARRGGDSLGEVGGRLVGEVLVGIIARDPESYLALEPDWEPTLPGHESRFHLRDILSPA